MKVTYLRTAALGVLALQLGACSENPTQPPFESAALSAESPAVHGLLASQISPSSHNGQFFDLFTDDISDLVPIRINSAIVDGFFSARMLSRPGVQRGAIRVEWGSREANDGGTVQIELVQLNLRSVLPVEIEFSGAGTFTDRATGRVVEFDVTGTAQQSAIHPDCVLFDFIGGGLYEVEIPARFKILN